MGKLNRIANFIPYLVLLISCQEKIIQLPVKHSSESKLTVEKLNYDDALGYNFKNKFVSTSDSTIQLVDQFSFRIDTLSQITVSNPEAVRRFVSSWKGKRTDKILFCLDSYLVSVYADQKLVETIRVFCEGGQAVRSNNQTLKFKGDFLSKITQSEKVVILYVVSTNASAIHELSLEVMKTKPHYKLKVTEPSVFQKVPMTYLVVYGDDSIYLREVASKYARELEIN
jgi:hypothetical protein